MFPDADVVCRPREAVFAAPPQVDVADRICFGGDCDVHVGGVVQCFPVAVAAPLADDLILDLMPATAAADRPNVEVAAVDTSIMKVL